MSALFNYRPRDASAIGSAGKLPNLSRGNKLIFLFLCFKVVFTRFRAKHPVKVHVWADISTKGSTEICIFSGIMIASCYVKILEETLPFIQNVYPDGHQFMQDNDPKHTSRLACEFLEFVKLRSTTIFTVVLLCTTKIYDVM